MSAPNRAAAAPVPAAGREAHHPIDPLFLARWSPRAFDGAAMPEADLMAMFEAARWAPSSFNAQPWRFLYARRDGPDWARFLKLLVPFNQSWAHRASVLVIILSDSEMEITPGQPFPSHTHSFDAGAAWACLALQAARMGYFAHGMAGVDWDAARAELKVPDRFRIEAAAAIGRMGDVALLDEHMRSREVPSGRKPATDFVFRGSFPSDG
jgi:nitroreductase